MWASFNDPGRQAVLASAGCRLSGGTHTSRTIMLADLRELFAAVPPDADLDVYAGAVVDENVLGKQTAATRRHSLQRLRELYALDPRVPLFRVLRRLWEVDAAGRPLTVLLAATARDPLLRLAAPTVVELQVGAELVRSVLLARLRPSLGARLNPASLDKLARHLASSWAQAGLLEGRMRKVRVDVAPTVGVVAFALWLGWLGGRTGAGLLRSSWMRLLGRSGAAALPLALGAHQVGLIRARAMPDAVSIEPSGLDPIVTVSGDAT